MKQTTFLCVTLLLVVIGCGRERLKPDDLPRREDEKASVNTSSSMAPAAMPDVKKDKTVETFEAAMQGDLQLVTSAIEDGWDVNTADESGRTALQLAAFDGHTAVVEYLIDHDAAVNHRDGAGRTALMYAATADNGPTVAALLQAGAEVNLLDAEEQFSALMFAAAEGQLDVVQKLLDAGADRSLKDIDGETAADFARNNQHAEVVELLQPAATN